MSFLSNDQIYQPQDPWHGIPKEEIKNQNTTLDLANGKSLDELVNEVNDILNLESDDEE